LTQTWSTMSPENQLIWESMGQMSRSRGVGHGALVSAGFF